MARVSSACVGRGHFVILVSRWLQHGMKKADYWKYTFEDALDLIARLPELAAIIYRRSYHDGIVPPYQPNLDFSANFAHIMGFKNQQFDELMRLYMVIHCDHEGGNVSAHTTHLVGSALSDPYLSFAAGLNGLAGPLHGLANQEVLRWVLDLQERFIREGKEVNHDTIRQFAWDTLKGGKVCLLRLRFSVCCCWWYCSRLACWPGRVSGHPRVRPRCVTHHRSTVHMPARVRAEVHAQRPAVQDRVHHLRSGPGCVEGARQDEEPVPERGCSLRRTLLKRVCVSQSTAFGDVPFGCPQILLTHYGLTEHNFYTVLFGVSRCIGVMSQLILDRALGFPLERPKSLTSQLIRQLIADKKQVADE
jgi:citrate synthase